MSDYISREELLKHQYRIDDSASLSTRDVVNVEDIEDCPPADVRENIHGEWINGDETRWKCSVCHYGVLDWNNTPFCPNCGADMRRSK